MERLVDPAIFADAVVVFWPGVFPARFELLEGKLVGGVAIDLIGAQKDEDRLGTMEARGLEQVDRAKRINFKIKNGDVACFVVGGLSRTVNDEIEAL